MRLASFLWDGSWAVDTNGVDGTKIIAITFIFLAYVLHPAMASVFRRVRAYRAWRDIERNQTVEITKYSFAAELFGGRGKWDAARIVTVLLSAFSLASWGLELSMGLAYYEGDADILNRPPPVTLVSDADGKGGKHWQVMPKSDFDCEERGCKSLSNVHDEYAESMYKVLANSTSRPGYVSGKIRVAFRSNAAEKAPTLLHYQSEDKTAVKNLECTQDNQPTRMNVYHGNDLWGSVIECNKGPDLFSVSYEYDSPTVSPPTILLTRSDGKVYLVVMESNNYPSYLYSVWTVGQTYSNSTDLHHEFYIAASMRLVQAVITGIVHGNASGRYSFKLVRMWSECGDRCPGELMYARPFGEFLTNDNVQIENLETVECGLESNADCVLCLGCLVVLTAVGITWSLCLRCKVGMDVYDRDELFRAVSVSGVKPDETAPSAIRVFVRKEQTGGVSVVISDRSNGQVVHPRIRRKGGADPVEDVEPSLTAAVGSKCNTSSRGATVPPGPTGDAGIASEYDKCLRRTAAPVGKRLVWVHRDGTSTTERVPEPTQTYPTCIALNVSSSFSDSSNNPSGVTETPGQDCSSREVREQTDPGPSCRPDRKKTYPGSTWRGVRDKTYHQSPWDYAASTFFVGECEIGGTYSKQAGGSDGLEYIILVSG